MDRAGKRPGDLTLPSAYQTEPLALGKFTAGHASYRTAQLREWLYRNPVLDPSLMTNLPPVISLTD